MSGIVDWLSDSYNPDGNGAESDRPRWSVLIRFVLAVAIAAAFVKYALPWLLNESGIEPWAIWLIIAAYLLVAYFMKPRIDTGELEWWNWFIDIPFYYHDDFDRMHVLIQVAVLFIFLPGILVTHGIVEFLILLWKMFA
jgi:hypothetical protein